MYAIKRTEKEINKLLDHCSDSEETGESTASGMTYEEGIKTAILWLTGDGFSHPIE